jgi:hypothetical protein
MPDRLYFSALLTSYAELRVTFEGATHVIKDWDATPDGRVGVYHASIPISSTFGSWDAVVMQDGVTIIDYKVGLGVSASCPSGITNWNLVVTYARSSAAVRVIGLLPPRPHSYSIDTQPSRVIVVNRHTMPNSTAAGAPPVTLLRDVL